jgi:hypothetical protein
VIACRAVSVKGEVIACGTPGPPQGSAWPPGPALRPWFYHDRQPQAGMFVRYSQTTKRESRTVELARVKLVSG